MKELLRSKTGKLVVKAVRISALLFVIAEIIIGILIIVLENSAGKHVDSLYTFFYSIAYIGIMVSIYLFIAAAITFIVMIIAKYRKRCCIGRFK